jgi:UTP:GlnB (protein PII) uridylyltransferase
MRSQRCELRPYSDLDLMLLLESPAINDLAQLLSDFLIFLWDIGLLIFLWDTGLLVGHSMRTLYVSSNGQTATVKAKAFERQCVTAGP